MVAFANTMERVNELFAITEKGIIEASQTAMK